MKISGGCYCALVLALVTAVSGVDVKAAVGDVVSFKPDIRTSLKESSITWKYTNGGEVIKVIEWDNDFKTLESLNPKFKRCVDLDMTTGELTIRDLQLDHTGLYTIEIDNKEQYKRFRLTVKESVPTPTLKQEKASNDVMNLTCEYNTMIRWACSYGEKPQPTKLAKPRQGEFITFKRAENPDVCCTCTLFNDVSEKTSNQICVKDLFHGLSTAIIIVIVVIIIIGILLIFVICYPHFCYKLW
ncbi:lymphocyte function-associated antigen 3 isoform X1 [Misgurnus anguillicaudatus]|uniref:lymphocyte function-associated antigen 3 isoform X1 n=1 Tax=Misgurnus anguillicaudatus TaxID=75329 RepID=UPI003CCF371D